MEIWILSCFCGGILEFIVAILGLGGFSLGVDFLNKHRKNKWCCGKHHHDKLSRKEKSHYRDMAEKQTVVDLHE